MNYKESFIKKMWSIIAEMDLQNIFPSALIAQAALESNWGRSVLAKDYNNLFGIKAGSTWTGKTVNMATKEVFDGVETSINSNFRVYDSWKDSIRDRNKLISSSPRYKAALNAETPLQQIEGLKAGGYATAPNYVSGVWNTIKSNSLERFDELKKKSCSTIK